MAWMRMMGAESVAYHEANVAGRADDHAGAALDYYGSRGETPLRWGGSGAPMLGVEGEAQPDEYRAVFGPGGARLPRTGAQLVSTRRPGIELVVSPHKSVAELGVIGRADDMHAIVDAERDATLAYLDKMCREMGGRRGEAATPTTTAGLTWVTSRHATTRAGDPQVHDHVLIANVVWMRDDRGGWKALDTAFLRDRLHAATAVGRMAAARTAVELGYGIGPDEGRSGRLGGWRIAGIPDEALAVHAKRSAQIDDIAGPGASYRSRNAAAREDRDPKTHEPVADLISRWRAELTAAGCPPAALVAGIGAAAARRPPVLDRVDDQTVGRVVDAALGKDGRLAEVKVFDRADVIVAVAPHLHGLPVPELDRVVAAVIAHPDCIPLLGVASARTQAYATAGVLAAEEHIAGLAEELVARPAARVELGVAEAAIVAAGERIGVPMTAGQVQAAETLLTSGAGLELVVGVAGSGKTTTLSAVRAGFETAGFTVIGTATSGQAARGLREGAGIAESRTIASLGWRLDHDQVRLTDRHVICLDEGGMTDDIDLARLLTAAHAAGAKVIISGDDRQLGAVGPGGGLGALLRRHPERVCRLTDNVRQVDPGERHALAELRSGTVDKAVAWYDANGRIHPVASADATVAAAVEGWEADVAAGRDSLLFAWRRSSVEALNGAARQAWARLGRLAGPEIEAPGGRRYRAGDRVVMLAPGPRGRWVTSERAMVNRVWLSTGEIEAVTAGGRRLRLSRDETTAERLDHSYAMTAHRTQGATVDTAHVLEDGGGRELAYVAMSRARHGTHLYVSCAPDEVTERVAWGWGAERRPYWAHDRGQPQPAAHLARLLAERQLLTDKMDRDIDQDLLWARQDLTAADQDLADLRAGTGHWKNTPAGTAARALATARTRHARAQERAADPNLGVLQRRHAAREVTKASRALTAAERGWQEHAPPDVDRIEAHRTDAIQRLSLLQDPEAARQTWLDHHPNPAVHLGRLDGHIAAYQGRGVQPSNPAPAQHEHRVERPGPGRREPEPDIDIGL